MPKFPYRQKPHRRAHRPTDVSAESVNRLCRKATDLPDATRLKQARQENIYIGIGSDKVVSEGEEPGSNLLHP